MRFSFVLVVAILALLAVSVACGGEKKASPTATPSSAATAIRSPMPAATLTPPSGIELRITGGEAEIVYESQLRSPEGIAMGPDGALYVADWLSYRIMRLAPDGELSVVVPIPHRFSSGPLDVAFDAGGTMFVALPSQILEVTSAGDAIQFAAVQCCIHKIEFGPDGNLYFANEMTNDVMLTRPDGSTEVVVTGLKHPFDVAFSPAGDLYVSEFGRDVLRLNPDGATSVFAREDFGSADPLHIAFDDTGNLYAHGNGTLFKFDAFGNNTNLRIDGEDPRRMLGFPKANPGGIVADENGYLYVTDSPNAKIARIDPDGRLEILVRGFNPNGIALAPDGNIYAVSSADFPQGPGELWRISPDGGRTVVGEFRDAPHAVTADPWGNVYVSLLSVADGSSRVVRVSQDGTIEDFLAQPYYYGSMAGAPNGGLYVYVSSHRGGSIHRAKADGTWSPFAEGLPIRGSWLYTLATGPDGTLYAADSNTGDVLRFTAVGTPSVLLNLPALVGPPNAISVAPDGSIFVQTGNIPYLIYRISPGGTEEVVASDVWGDPVGMTFDADGTLYVSRGGSIDRIYFR